MNRDFYERLSKAEQIKVTEFKLQNLQVLRNYEIATQKRL